MNGCYAQSGSYGGLTMFRLQAQAPATTATTTATAETSFDNTMWSLFAYLGTWRVGVPGVVALYGATCQSALPPGAGFWTTDSPIAALPAPVVTSSAHHLSAGQCASPPPKNCSCSACQAMWGKLHNGTCPDLFTVPPDLVRPPMLSDGTPPDAGRRVKVVQVGG